MIFKINKTVYVGLIVLSLMILLSACADMDSEADTGNEEVTGITALQQYTYDSEDLNEEWDEDEVTAVVELSDSSTVITGSGAEYTNGLLTINSAGTFVIGGTLSNGQIMIDVSDDDIVHIILNGVDITNDHAPALYEKNADRTILTLPEGSSSILTDGSSYNSTDDDDPDSALYATHDLSINGPGELAVTGNYNNAIGSQDNLVIVNSSIKANAQNNGIKGRDLLAVQNADIDVVSQNDGLKSNNADSESKGFIQLDGGTFTINTVNDGIQAETNLIVNGGSFDIRTTGTVDSYGSDDSQSMKALKAGSQISVAGGDFTLNSTDDAVHSNGNITINGGTFLIDTGDDAFHADFAAEINDGEINIKSSYEGIEGATVEINGGTIEIIASDDGINAAGGSDDDDEESSDGRSERVDQFTPNDYNHIQISGGDLTIVSGGDGIDSNGELYIEGGKIRISGPVSGGDGPLDANGEIYINGGDIIASGSRSMAQAPPEDSKQNSIIISATETLSQEDTLYVKNSSGDTIFEYSPANDYGLVLFSSPDLIQGNDYGIYSGNTKLFDVSLSGTNAIVDESGNETELSGMGGGRPQN